MQKTPRFLDLFHAGEVAPGEIDDFIDAWHVQRSRVQLHVHLGLTWSEYLSWVRIAELPTVSSHQQHLADCVWIGDPVNGELLRVHGPQRCRPACPVHWPTDHPLVRAEFDWDVRNGFMRRRCEHGLAHPDPDDQQVRLHPELAEHRCDGCCRAQVIDGELTDRRALGGTS
jgi:hypothetical protein